MICPSTPGRRDDDGVVVNAQEPLGQAGLAAAGGAVQEDRVLGDDGRAKLVSRLSAAPGPPGTGGATCGRSSPWLPGPSPAGYIGRSGDGRGAGIVADLKAVRCQAAASLREVEGIVVPTMPFTSSSCCWRRSRKNGLQYERRQFQRLAETCNVLMPEMYVRRRTRSVIRDWGIPEASTEFRWRRQ